MLAATDLLPETWRRLAGAGPVRAFNPGLLRDAEGWLLAYRIVAADGRRRLALGRLDAALRPIEGSQFALSDHVRFRPGRAYPEIATQWFADPRLYRFDGRIFVYWNSGWHEPRNYQFVQELDPRTLEPRGHPRELVLRGERQKLEKNWTLFRAGHERANEAHVVYSIEPHRVLACSFDGDEDLECIEVARHAWRLEGYPASHGGLRGGAPPVRHGAMWWSIGHSVHDGPDGYRYVAAAYGFEAVAPFRPAAAPVRPLALAPAHVGRRVFPRLNPAVGGVVYPCGAALDGARWLISHGIDDELCAISILPHAELAAAVRPLAPAAAAGPADQGA